MTRTCVAKAIILLLAAATLAGCDYRYSRSYVRPTYRPHLFNYAAGGRDLAVETIGNPFAGRGIDDQTFPDFVVASMQGHNRGQPTNLTTAPGATARPQYKVAIVFDPVEPATYRALCEGEVRAGPTVERVRVKAAFCRTVGGSQQVLTAVRGSVVQEAGPDSPAFRRMMAGVTRDLFPLWDADFDDDDCPSFIVLCH